MGPPDGRCSVTDVDRLKSKAAEIAEREGRKLLDRTPGPESLHHRALSRPPNGVASNFQAGDPYPTYLRRGKGSKVWDVDGNEYLDFHGGFGVNVVGHAHPKIVEAIRAVADQGIHFAVTTESTVALAEAICERFQLEQMRFVNSGTEATMDAIRVARAATGRDTIVKMEGSYHGHHHSVLFAAAPAPKGLPKVLTETVIVVPFNAAAAVEQAFADKPGEIAAVILEPVMMNIGLVVPQSGYLQALRDICERNGAALIYDEVKCGGTIAYGGTTERYGVRPHLAAYAKAIGGGVTIGAFGGEASFMEWVTKGAAQQGTFNGTPLSAAAGLAALTQVLTKEAYDHLGKLGTMLAEGCQRAIDEDDLPAHTVDLGAKGCVSYRKEPLLNYRDFLQTIPELFYASFTWIVNRGIFMTPGDEEQWTISVQHTEEDIRRYVDAYAAFCAELAA